MKLPEQQDDQPRHSRGPKDSLGGSAKARSRRSQAERTKAMRARLAVEAYRIVAERGVRGLTIRSLAAAAGVSQGAVLHHFPDKNSIILLAIEQALTMAREDSRFWFECPGDAEGVLRAMLSEFHAFFFSDKFWVAMGITIESSKDQNLFPAVRAMVGSLRLPVYRAWEERLIDLGWDATLARRDVRAAAALVSGAAVRRFWADPDDVTRAIEEEWITSRLTRLR